MQINGLHTCVHVTRPICGEQLELTFGGRASFHFSSVSRRRGGEGAGGGGWELGVGEGDRGWDDCKPSPCQLRASDAESLGAENRCVASAGKLGTPLNGCFSFDGGFFSRGCFTNSHRALSINTSIFCIINLSHVKGLRVRA